MKKASAARSRGGLVSNLPKNVTPTSAKTRRAWTMLGSRENSKPRVREMLKMAMNPTCQAHALLESKIKSLYLLPTSLIHL